MKRDHINRDLILKNVQNVLSLSDFDVNMSFVSNNMERISTELSEFSSSNMAVVEETTASMHQVNDAILSSTEILENLSDKSESLAEMNNQNSKQLVDMAKIRDTVVSNTDDMSEK